MVVCCLEFQEFVRNQEVCRKRWLDSRTTADHLKVSVAEKEQENVALQTKLKHARWVF